MMITKTIMKQAIAVAVLVLGIGQTQAANNYVLELDGAVDYGFFSNQTIGSTQIDMWNLHLFGLFPGNSITVSQGDTINATITLDQSFTIPASVDSTQFLFFLGGTGLSSILTQTGQTTISFFNGLLPGPSGGNNSNAVGAIDSLVIFSPPKNTPITFDKVTASFTITKLDQPVTLDSAGIFYALFRPAAPIPEPESYAMLLAGLGLMGAIARRRKQNQAA